MSCSKNSAVSSIVTTLLCLVVVALPNAASADNAAGDFSIASNPNGVWSYGWSATLGSTFHLDTNNSTAAEGQNGVDGWLSGLSPEGIPSALYNSNPTQSFVSPTIPIQPGQLALNPNNGNHAIVRWTAPSSGLFNITATFAGVSTAPGGDSVDVHILDNGTSIFDSTVFGTPSPTSYSGIQNLTQGATIDFAVGYGSDGSDHEDVTALSASIVAVPEPSTVLLTMGGLFGLLCSRKRIENING
jgi:hypothetical protein